MSTTYLGDSSITPTNPPAVSNEDISNLSPLKSTPAEGVVNSVVVQVVPFQYRLTTPFIASEITMFDATGTSVPVRLINLRDQLTGFECDVSNLTTILFVTAVFPAGYTAVNTQLDNDVDPVAACGVTQYL